MMVTNISLAGLDKGEVLAALYNASKPQGMGFLQYDPTPMTPREAEGLLSRSTNFDYLKGRVMKINLSGDTLDTWGYDRDNGSGAAERVISILRESGKTNPEIVEAIHRDGVARSARDVKNQLNDETTIEVSGAGMVVIELGYGDLAPVVNEAVDEAVKRNQR